MQPVTYTAPPTRSQQSWRRLPKGAGGAQPAAQVRRRPPERRQSGPGQEEGRPAARNKGGRGGDGEGGGRDGGPAAQEARQGEGQGGQQQGGRHGAQACLRLPPLSGAQLFFLPNLFHVYLFMTALWIVTFLLVLCLPTARKVSGGHIFRRLDAQKGTLFIKPFKRASVFTTRAFKSYNWSVGLAKRSFNNDQTFALWCNRVFELML